jgi:hypothetical protein
MLTVCGQLNDAVTFIEIRQGQHFGRHAASNIFRFSCGRFDGVTDVYRCIGQGAVFLALY